MRDDPTVRGEELGSGLHELRLAAGLTLAEAGRMVDASDTKISRMESGKRSVATEDVAALLAVYRVTGKRRSELLRLAREADRRGWWQRHRPDFPERQRTLISLENRAVTITNFEGMNIPGLLQTGEYTRALMIECGNVPEDEVEQRMVTRLDRHAVLRKRNGPDLVAIIDELALHRVVGGRDVTRRQLEYLAELYEHPRVVPNTGRANAGLNGSFAVIRRREGPPVVFLENLTSSLFLEEPEEIASYQHAVRELLYHALDAAESRETIAALARSLDTEADHT